MTLGIVPFGISTALIKINLPICREEALEMMCSIDVSSHTKPEHGWILTVEEEGPIDDIQEKVKVSSVSQVACHTLKHSGNQVNPHVLMELIQPSQLLQQEVCYVQWYDSKILLLYMG